MREPDHSQLPVAIATTEPRSLRVVDLSQPISESMAGWRGSERAEITVTELPIAHTVPSGLISATYLNMVTHAGTHVDAARHFFPSGKTIDEYPLSRFVCRGVALDVRRDGPLELGAEELAAVDPGIRRGDAVLLYFGYAERYSDESYYDHPFLTDDSAKYLAEREISVLGVDLLTPDRPSHRRENPFSYPVHSSLLGQDILIIENLGPGLAEVVGRDFLFVMAPLRIAGSDASPVAPMALLAPDA